MTATRTSVLRPASNTGDADASVLGRQPVRTTCCYCGVGCGIVIDQGPEGRPRLRGDDQHDGSRGLLCTKGSTLLHTALTDAHRLRQPELRRQRSETRSPATWDEAIAHAAGELRRIVDTYGPDAVGIYISGQCLTEEYYLFNKLAKGCLGTNNIDTNSRLCMSSAVAGYRKTLGTDSVPGCYEDFETCDTFLIAGSNAAWCHPVIFRRIEARRAADANVRIVCIDPRRTDTAVAADLHLALRPGTDVPLFHALGHCLLRDGHADRDYIAAHTNGWSALEPLLRAWTPERAAAVCGLEAADIERCAAWLGGTRRFLSLWTMGLNQSAMGTDKNVALINLSLITGKIGIPGCGPLSLTGQPNAMGGREVGGLANLLPAHRDLADAGARAEVEDYWGVPRGRIAANSGLTATEMFQALRDGRMRAIWIACTNPLVSLPEARLAEEALRAAELVIVQDIAPTATTAYADVVLPAATWLEKTGTMTSSERRVTLLEAALPAPGEALSDVAIIQRMGHALGFAAHFAQPNEEAVWREHIGLTAGRDCDMTGIDYALLRRERAVQWPRPAGAAASTMRLFSDGRFNTPDGRARLQAVDFAERSEPLDEQHPLVLTTGRIRDQWHTMSRSGVVARLRQHIAKPSLEMHPADAAARGLRDGDIAEIVSRRGDSRLPLRVTGDIRPGVVFAPMHWGRGPGGDALRINNAASGRLDPVSKEPDLKYAAVQVRPWRPPARRIVVVGAGAAALALAEAHAPLTTAQGGRDRLVILGGEAEPIYDRVQLPHLVDGSRSFDQLVRGRIDDLRRYGAELRSGCPVMAIDRAARRVVLADGSSEAYDLLVLATGSRPNRPTGSALAHPAVLGLRTRADAAAIIAACPAGTTAVIQGAGLLGIELADALAARGCQVVVLQRGGRLMGRQLDTKASELLAAELRRRGIDVRLGRQAASVVAEDGAVRAVVLDDGERLPASLLVAAAGTVANDELARAAGLDCQRGVVVDAFLRSSDPAILALGECASFNGASVGTTAGASAQARAAAAWLRGDETAPFSGWIEANILKVRGLALASCGLVESDGIASSERVVFEHPGAGIYQQALIRGDRLQGVLMYGDTTGFSEHVELIRSGLELEDRRRQLLRLGLSDGGPRGRLVCTCHQVGEDDIRSAIASGCASVAAIGARCKAGTACGSCRPEIARLLATSVAADGVAG
jgi:ferredoxin-nitrate reductase